MILVSGYRRGTTGPRHIPLPGGRWQRKRGGCVLICSVLRPIASVCSSGGMTQRLPFLARLVRQANAIENTTFWPWFDSGHGLGRFLWSRSFALAIVIGCRTTVGIARLRHFPAHIRWLYLRILSGLIRTATTTGKQITRAKGHPPPRLPRTVREDFGADNGIVVCHNGNVDLPANSDSAAPVIPGRARRQP